MSNPRLDEPPLLARFDLIGIEREGLILDRESGEIFRLNATGYEVWRALVDGESTAHITANFVQRFGLSQVQAEQDIRGVLSAFPVVPHARLVDQYRWRAIPSGYGFFENDVLLCEVDPRGDSLRLAKDLRPTEREAWVYLKSVVPKVLALRGTAVLHASAVDIGGSLLVFSGRSGAGKTTSARAFAEAGGSMVSEDLLVIGSARQNPLAVIGGESAILSWLSAAGKEIADHPENAMDCTNLDRCLCGDQVPIRRILLLDAERRSGSQITFENLPKVEALVALVESIYFGSAAAKTWRAALETLKEIVSATSTARTTMPSGLQDLKKAARASYSEMMVS